MKLAYVALSVALCICIASLIFQETMPKIAVYAISFSLLTALVGSVIGFVEVCHKLDCIESDSEDRSTQLYHHLDKTAKDIDRKFDYIDQRIVMLDMEPQTAKYRATK